MATKTAWQLLQESPLRKLSFGCNTIDSTIGKFPCRGICEISGEAGAGKTQVGLTLAIEAVFSTDYSQLVGSAAYITCGEGLFPIKRLSQLAQKYENAELGIFTKDILSHIHIEECMNFEDVAEAVGKRIPEMCRTKSIRILIIDSLAGMIRHEYDAMNAADMRDRTNFIFAFAKQLKWLSDIFQIGILVINQVTAGGMSQAAQGMQVSSSYQTSQSIPALGLTWSTCVTHRYIVSKSTFSLHSIPAAETTPLDEQEQQAAGANSIVTTHQHKRILELVFSPLYPSNGCYFYIDGNGLHGL